MLAHRQTRADHFTPWRCAHPPRHDLSSFTPRATTHRTTPRAPPDRFRASDGHAPRPVWYASRPEPCASVLSRAPSPRYALGILPRKVVTTSRHRTTLQGGGRFFLDVVCSKSQFALTVRNIPCFLGFDLRIAVFGKFSF